VTERAFTAADLALAVTAAGPQIDGPMAAAFLAAFERQGLVERNGDGWTLTERGQRVSAQLAETQGTA
jgi:hypothetical protein